MKKVIILSVSCLILAAFITPPNSLVGRWQQKFPDGSTLTLVLRQDNSYDYLLNNKSFVNGKYYFRKDTFGISDSRCGTGYYGRYHADFFAKDSVRFVLIQDTCLPRQQTGSNLTLGRVKTAKP